jgi:phage repressor protein C with HTH and peptisase S24 domain/DNA-binding XRE family transcriptional regulator
MSLGEIIRNKREELGLTLDEVGSRIGFSKPYLSTIETGKVNNPPSDELLQKLETVLGFEPGTLLYLAHMERLPSDVRERVETTEAENEKWRQLNKDPKKNGSQESPVKKPAISPGRLVPIINKVAAGYPADFDDLDYPVGIADDYIRCPDVHDPNAFAVRVVGDSMEPKFREGDIIVFSPAAEVRNGDDCFVRFATPHETTFKRVFFEQNDAVRLQPRNEKYPPTMIEGKRINGIYRAIIRYETL